MGGEKKEYLPLHGGSVTVLGAAVRAFAAARRIGCIVVVAPPDAQDEARASLPADILADHGRVLFAEGGCTRRASVHNALSLLECRRPSHVLVHDGARPWIKPELIEQVIDAAIEFGAAIPAIPLTETPKELARTQGSAPGLYFITRHLRRAEFCSAQTPQGFAFPELISAHEKAAAREAAAREAGENLEYTDDSEVWGEFVGQVAAIPGDPSNRKITYPQDLA